MRNSVTKIWCLAPIFFSVGISQTVLAQSAPDASQLERQFEATPEPKSQAGNFIPEFDPLTAPDIANSLQFTLQGANIEGSTVFDDAQFQTLYADKIGQQISVADIYALANTITKLYADAGYSLSRAIVPQQEIDENGGVIRLQVIEGYIEDVVIEGELHDRRDFFGYFKQQITAERPIRSQTLERYTLLADDLPGTVVKSTLRRSPERTGAVTLILQVEDKTLGGSVTVDNRGTDAVGPIQVNGQYTIGNALGLLGETRLQIVNSGFGQELVFGSIQHDMQLHPEGTYLTLEAKRSESEPGTSALRAIDLESESTTASVTITHPFIRSRQTNLSAYAKAEIRESESLTLGATSSKDSIRSGRIGARFDHSDAYQGSNFVGLEVSQGIEGLGSSKNGDLDNSRANGQVDYTKATLDISRTQGLGFFHPALAPLQLHVAATGQWSKDALLSSEECSLGGASFGRAYDSSEITGDHCLAGSIEFRFNPKVEAPFRYLQPYAFYDIGGVWNINRIDPTDIESASLASAGLGVRFGVWEYFSGSLEVSKPLTRIVANEGNDDIRVFFSLTGRF